MIDNDDLDRCDQQVRELESQIKFAVLFAIANFPDVDDYYLRIDPLEMTAKAIYLTDHLYPDDEYPDPDEDVALLNVMIDRNNCDGYEDWVPDYDAIHEVAECYRFF